MELVKQIHDETEQHSYYSGKAHSGELNLSEVDSDAGKTDENGIQVYIGQEAPLATMRDCSVVTASYDLGGGMYGRIGIVGPKRMDYDKVVKVLRTMTSQLDEIYGSND